MNEDLEGQPIVEGLTDPFETPSIPVAASQGQAAIHRHAATIRKLKEQEQEIATQQNKIQVMLAQLDFQRQEYMHREFNLPPSRPPMQETPGPHRLQQKADRPEDVAYKNLQEEQQQAEQQQAEAQQHTGPDSPEKALMSVFQSLTKVLSDNNKHLHSSDVTEPGKFNGSDSQWEDWYLQLRTYFEAKG
jgi:hypothetical protein